MRETLYDQIAANKRKTYFFVFVFTLILAVLGYVVVHLFNFGKTGLVVAGLFIIGYNLIIYFNADKLALIFSGATPADPEQYQVLHNVVEEMAIAGGIPRPKVYIIDQDAPNAFATGRNPQHAAVAATTGLLRVMNREELQGVIAHEISHIRHYDILIMTIAGMIGGMIILLRDVLLRSSFLFGRGRSRSRGGGRAGAIFLVVGLVVAILAPLFVALIRSAISRQREYLADAGGAYLTRYPQGLANALVRLKELYQPLPRASQATAHLYIASPFGKDRMDVESLFSTHPPIDRRVARLKSLVL